MGTFFVKGLLSHNKTQRLKKRRSKILCGWARIQTNIQDAEALAAASERAVAGRCLQWH